IVQAANNANIHARPMRANARAIVIEAFCSAFRWLDELIADPRHTPETLALREGKTERSIKMTLSLAFLSPDIVKAAVEGRLPRGYGLRRLVRSSDGMAPAVASARTRVAGITNRPPALPCRPAGLPVDLHRSERVGRASYPQALFEIGPRGNMPKSSLGNENL